MSEKFSIKRRLKSFKYAGKGVKCFLEKEHNAWIHCTAIVVVTIAGLSLGITCSEWTIIILCFAGVLSAEAFNTAIEKLVDLVCPEFNPAAGKVKDIAAGAVLICAAAAAIIGIIIFLPYII